jgi:phosphoglycolate phosphatase
VHSKLDFVLFDLDGTLTDPLVGISRSMNFALRECGFDEISDERVAECIGPPLDQNFKNVTGTSSPDLITRLVGKYRERFSQVGYAENRLYPGVPEALRDLHKHGTFTMAVCTSKRADYAKMILSMFELEQYFAFVNGGISVFQKSNRSNPCWTTTRLPQTPSCSGTGLWTSQRPRTTV